jgi:hypothetical protein
VFLGIFKNIIFGNVNIIDMKESLKALVALVKEKYDLRLAPFASNYYESSTSCVLFTSHEYVVNVIFSFDVCY